MTSGPQAALPTGSIVDGHVAVGDGPRFRALSVDDVLRTMDSAGIDRAVLGPVGRWAAVDNAEANDALAGWVSAHPSRLSAYAVANPWYGERAVAELARAIDQGAVGLKLIPALQGTGLLSPLLEPLLDVVEEHARAVYVVTGVPVASEPLQLAELAKRRPATTFVMGRSGRTDFSLDLLPAFRSAANIVAETAYNGASLIAELVGELGAGRVVFASDAPLTDVRLELDRVIRSGLPDAELREVLCGTAGRLGLTGTNGGAPS